MFSDLLKQGKTIRISKKGYTSSEFHIIGKNVYCYNKEIGIFKHNHFTTHTADFDEHIITMLQENFTITIY